MKDEEKTFPLIEASKFESRANQSSLSNFLTRKKNNDRYCVCDE